MNKIVRIRSISRFNSVQCQVNVFVETKFDERSTENGKDSYFYGFIQIRSITRTIYFVSFLGRKYSK